MILILLIAFLKLYFFCRQKSDGILAEAESVRKALEEARQAQEKAKLSIDEANGDIGTIDKDLTEVMCQQEIATILNLFIIFFIYSLDLRGRRDGKG